MIDARPAASRSESPGVAASSQGDSRSVTYASLIGDIALVISKLIAAVVGGSAAMMAEAVHSIADTGNSIFLLIGQKRMQKPPDDLHPFGHGRELYFWTLIVSLMMFAGGGVASLFEGISHLRHPEPLGDPKGGYIVLALSFLFTAITAGIALKRFSATREPGESYWRAFRRAKDPTIFTILFEDLASLVGVVIAFLGIWLGRRLQNPYLDGAASILIGLLLAGVAFLLIDESRKLLLGERVHQDTLDDIRRITEADAAVTCLGEIYSTHLAPEEAIAVLRVEFRPHLRAPEVAEASRRIERAIQARHPEIKHAYIDP